MGLGSTDKPCERTEVSSEDNISICVAAPRTKMGQNRRTFPTRDSRWKRGRWSYFPAGVRGKTIWPGDLGKTICQGGSFLVSIHGFRELRTNQAEDSSRRFPRQAYAPG